MLHSAVRSGAVTHLMNSSAALRSAGVLFLKRYQLPPPVGEPRCFEAGSIPTPKGNLALSFTAVRDRDRKSTRLNSSHVRISYAVFCLKKKNAAISASTHTNCC